MGSCMFDSRWVWTLLTYFRGGLSFNCSVAHVDQIHRLAWQSTDAPTEKHLASCSEDGTLKIFVVQC